MCVQAVVFITGSKVHDFFSNLILFLVYKAAGIIGSPESTQQSFKK